MARPIIYTTTRRVAFSELDPFNHLGTAQYAAYFVDHRMQGLSEHLGWNQKSLRELGFLTLVRRIEVDFLRSARADDEIVMTSFVREFDGPDATIDCTMTGPDGSTLANCVMVVAHVDTASGHATDWPPDHAALFFDDEPSGDEPRPDGPQ